MTSIQMDFSTHAVSFSLTLSEAVTEGKRSHLLLGKSGNLTAGLPSGCFIFYYKP